MEDWHEFATKYTRADYNKIRCAIHLCTEEGCPAHSNMNSDASNQSGSFMAELLVHLYGNVYGSPGAVTHANDELLGDLFENFWTTAVYCNSCGSEPLAYEVLARGLYGRFARAYSMPLGMDQGVPLEIAIGALANTTGTPEPEIYRKVLDAVEILQDSERCHDAVRNYAKWSQWIKVRKLGE